jgi:hypothetical protein
MARAPRVIPPINVANVMAVPWADTPSARDARSCQITSHDSAARPAQTTITWTANRDCELLMPTSGGILAKRKRLRLAA